MTQIARMERSVIQELQLFMRLAPDGHPGYDDDRGAGMDRQRTRTHDEQRYGKTMTRGLRTASARGFTLIEVMVVMVIIAILVTAVSLSLKGDRMGEALDEEAQRLSALLNLAREEAVMRDRDLGLVLAEDGYLFVQRDEERASEDAAQYVTLADDAMFRVRALPFGTTLVFEARANPARNPAATTATISPLAPRVLALANDMFLPQGLLTLRNPATPRIARIAIEQNGARVLPDEATP